MLLVQNSSILSMFDVRKSEGDGVYEFINKETKEVIQCPRSKSINSCFQNILAAPFFPNSALIVADYLTNQWAGCRDCVKKSFNYKGLKFPEDYDRYFEFEDKPKIYFVHQHFYAVKESVLEGNFNRRYFDTLIDQVIPLLKNEESVFETFFQFFDPDYALRGKFNLVGRSLSNQTNSVFSNSSKVELDFDLTSLHGKLLVGESGIELIDSSFVTNFEKLSQGLGLGSYVSQVPLDKLTIGDKLSYTDDMSNFKNWFYSQNNLVNV